jgi:epoxyqueuosine reductase QueG
VKFSRDVTDPALQPMADRTTPDIDALQPLDDAGFAARFEASAITRTKRRGLERNAEVVLENRRALRGDLCLLAERAFRAYRRATFRQLVMI